MKTTTERVHSERVNGRATRQPADAPEAANPPGKADIARYISNRQMEIDGAALYQVMADVEKMPQAAELYRKLAEEERGHARIWEEKLLAAGEEIPPARPGPRARILGWIVRRFGPNTVLSSLPERERHDSRTYSSQPDAQIASISADEKRHAQLLSAVNVGTGGVKGSKIAALEGRHRAIGGNALRAAVLGANDGLVSNLSLVMGVAGAELSNGAIIVTGLAGLLAGASSMALGEWLSVQSSRELYSHQIAIEAAELEANPEDEERELALIYQSKGLDEEQAGRVAAQLMQDKANALDTLVREELGVDPDELGGSAWVAAITSFVLFAIGAILPVIPYFFLSGLTAVAVSTVVSAVALFVLGGGITLLTGRSVLFSGTRQVLFGLAAAALTFGIGRLIGVSIAG